MKRFLQHKQHRRMRVVCPSEDEHRFHEFTTNNLPTIELRCCCDDRSIESLFLEFNRGFFSNPHAIPAGIEQCQVRQVGWVPNCILQGHHSTEGVPQYSPFVYSTVAPNSVCICSKIRPFHCGQVSSDRPSVAAVVIED